MSETKWDGPYDFHTVIKEWAESGKTIMYQHKSSKGIILDRTVMHGGIPTTHNFNKKDILEAEWYIEK